MRQHRSQELKEGVLSITIRADFWLHIRCGDSVDNTIEENSSVRNPNALVAVSKRMRAVKLCTDKILQFLTTGAG